MDSICRLCGQTSVHLESVFSFVESGRLLSDLIYIVCPIRIEVNDDLPKKICAGCLEVVVSSIRLRESSVKSDLNFRLHNLDESANRLEIQLPFEVKQETPVDDDENFESERQFYEQQEEDPFQSDSDDEQIGGLLQIGSQRKSIYQKVNGRFACPHQCGATFAHKNNARRHVRMEHESNGYKPPSKGL